MDSRKTNIILGAFNDFEWVQLIYKGWKSPYGKKLLLVIFTLPLLLDGCYTPLIEGAQQGYDASQRGSLKTEAESKDPADEYNLGNNYCCQGGGSMNDMTVYDNNKATYWYCKAARQGYGPAQLQLARLYSGHAIRGLHVALRASALVDTPETDFSIALVWASLAVKNKGEGDIDDATELQNKITQRRRVKTAQELPPL